MGAKQCCRKMILALRCVPMNSLQKRLCNGGGAVSTRCQDNTAKQAGKPRCAATGPFLLPYMAVDSAPQAEASLFSSRLPLLFLRVSSLLFQLSQYQPFPLQPLQNIDFTHSSCHPISLFLGIFIYPNHPKCVIVALFLTILS